MRGKRRQKEQRKKRFVRVFVAAFAVILLLFVALGFVAKSMITRELLVEEIEGSINSEVEIGGVDVSIWSFPARITLSDVSLTPTKADAEHNDAAMDIERVDLRVSLLALLFKEINVKSITISGADITTTYRKDGSTSIEELFDEPGEEDEDSHDAKSSEDGKSEGFNVFEQKEFITKLGKLTIEHSRANVLLEKMGVKLRCSNLNVVLSEMRVDPNRLSETNTAYLKVSTDIRADSVDGWQYGELFLAGEASVKIFNVQTGETEPDVEGDFSLSKESWLNTRVPFITKAWNLLGVLEKVGIKVAKLPERASFGRSEAIAAHYHLGKITVRKPLSIWVGDWELAALDQSWLDTGTDEHEAHGELLASKSASQRFLSTIEKGVQFLPDEVQPVVVGSVKEKLYRNERLVIDVQSTGDFSDPKIRPSGAIPDLTESAKEAGKDLLKEKARGLLDGLLK